MSAPRYLLAVTFAQRLRGLLGRRASLLACGQELVLVPCRSIHTYGMKEPIDVAFADRTGTVLLSVRALGPHRVLRCAAAYMAIERFAASPENPWYEAGDKVNVALL